MLTFMYHGTTYLLKSMANIGIKIKLAIKQKTWMRNGMAKLRYA